MSTGKNILLTGASAGIGLATARRLTGSGFEVWGSARNADRLPEIPGLHPLALDLSDPVALRDSLDAALTASGGFDVVINNAGNGVWGPVEDLGDEQLRDQFQVLVFGPLFLINRCLPAMRARGVGLVVNVTSLAADFPVPFLGAYSAAKAAMSSLSWTLQMELLDQPIRFVDIKPGDINTGFNDAMARVGRERAGPYARNLRRAFAVYDRGMRGAPSPDVVARAIESVVVQGGRGAPTVAVGGFFQARVAPLLARLAPTRLLRWGTGEYYRLKR